MTRNYLLALAAVWLLICNPSAEASHILGGEIRMETTADANRFSFSMIQFWDQTKLTVAKREPSVEILFYSKRNDQLVFRASLPFLSSRTVRYPNQVCSGLRTLNTVEGTYKSTISLDPSEFTDSEGYYIVWERCCRNADISNIQAPSESGLVFYLEFPALSVRNSSPLFTSTNGDYICLGLPYSMNVTATDADGDELRYTLTTPTRGNTDQDNPIGTDTPKSLYPLVEWLPGISTQNMIPGNPALSIQEKTGKLTVTASKLGLYVFTVQCEEYRNGVKIGVVRRDFQSLVIECKTNQPPIPTILHLQQPTRSVKLCSGGAVTLEVQEAGDWIYQWRLEGQNIPEATRPVLRIDKPGKYTVVKSPNNSGNEPCTKPVESAAVEVVGVAALSARISKNKSILCEGGTIELRADLQSSFNYTYQWRRGTSALPESGPVLSVQEPGIYYLLIQQENNGCRAMDSVTISSESIKVTLPAQAVIKAGQRVRLNPVVTTSSKDLDYQWAPPNGLSTTTQAQPFASPQQTTSYTVRVKTPGGCIVEASTTVLVKECEEILIPKPTVIHQGIPALTAQFCAGQSLVLETDLVGDWIYQWQLNGKDIAGATGPGLKVGTVGLYSVIRSAKTSNPGICMIPALSAAVEVMEGTPPVAQIRPSQLVLCSGVPLQLDASAGGSLRYEWMYGGRSRNESTPQIDIYEPGIYSVSVLNEKNGCVATDSVRINQESIQVNLPGEISIIRGESVTLRAQVITAASPIHYVWTPARELSNATDSVPTAMPNQSTWYSLLVETPGGCQATDSLLLTIIDRVYIPDAFSPNGDGVNDVFVIQHGDSLIESIRIYNRWGQIVHSATGYETPWNGQSNDALVPKGLYNYIIKTSKTVHRGAIRVMY